MLVGHADRLSDHRSSTERLLPDHESNLDDDDEVPDSPEPILYTASFEEFASNIIHYDMVIWFSISLLLVLAWGIGLIMLLYLPIRRYVLQKDISSRKLYVTPREIVYKVSRPSFVPLCGIIKKEKHIPLNTVIDIIVEQGWLQSLFGLQTFRVESIVHGKASPIDELHVHGVASPAILRKVILEEAAKVMQDAGRNWKLAAFPGEREAVPRMTSLTEGPSILRSPTKSWKATGSPRYVSTVSGELLLHKLDEVSRSVKKIELLIEKPPNTEDK